MTVDLVIAGRRIRLCSQEWVRLSPDERFRAFTVPGEALQELYFNTAADISSDIDPCMPYPVMPLISSLAEPELFIEVDPGPGEVPAGAVRVFDAQLMEEVPGGVINSGVPFWEVYRGQDAIYAKVFLKDPERTALLEMPDGKERWRIFAGAVSGSLRPADLPGEDSGSHCPEDHITAAFATEDRLPGSAVGANPRRDERSGISPGTAGGNTPVIEVNPLPYPLDGLLLYFLFSRAGDIMIHGSGAVSGGKGWIFSGRSGSGKTTIARIFDSAGDRVIHDDRLVLRKEQGRWVMYSIPVYRNDEPRSAALDHLWIIRHGKANISEPVAGAEAVAMIMANCIQQNWDNEVAAILAAAADDLASSVKVSRLSFLPDGSIRDYLRLRQEEDISLAADAVLSLLDEGKNITVTAGGYSMWPAIRPGDIVVIAPCGDEATAAGQVVALRRDGGFVLHRVTNVITAGGRKLIVTCGDAAARADEPAGPDMIAGTVISVNRSGRQFAPPRRRLPRWLNRVWAMAVSALR